MRLVGRLRRSSVHGEVMVDQSRQGHDLERRGEQRRQARPRGPGSVGGRLPTSLWWLLGFCTVFRLRDRTVSGGGGGGSLTGVIRSGFRARASTLHQLTGWLVSSGGRARAVRQAAGTPALGIETLFPYVAPGGGASRAL